MRSPTSACMVDILRSEPDGTTIYISTPGHPGRRSTGAIESCSPQPVNMCQLGSSGSACVRAGRIGRAEGPFHPASGPYPRTARRHGRKSHILHEGASGNGNVVVLGSQPSLLVRQPRVFHRRDQYPRRLCTTVPVTRTTAIAATTMPATTPRMIRALPLATRVLGPRIRNWDPVAEGPSPG